MLDFSLVRRPLLKPGKDDVHALLDAEHSFNWELREPEGVFPEERPRGFS
jgi:hypothetical protein